MRYGNEYILMVVVIVCSHLIFIEVYISSCDQISCKAHKVAGKSCPRGVVDKRYNL